MNTATWLWRLPSMLFFPDSAYLADKWWHRLALVIFWIWLIVAAGVVVGAIWDVWEAFEYARYLRSVGEDYDAVGRSQEVLFEATVAALSLLVPVVAYRVILFIGVGNAWKAGLAPAIPRASE